LRLSVMRSCSVLRLSFMLTYVLLRSSLSGSNFFGGVGFGLNSLAFEFGSASRCLCVSLTTV
jgi:hypothetical protein